MDRRALGAVASARRFAALAALVAAGLTRRAAHPRAGPAGPAWHAAEGNGDQGGWRYRHGDDHQRIPDRPMISPGEVAEREGPLANIMGVLSGNKFTPIPHGADTGR